MKLKGSTVIVTGASSGIGRETVRRLVKAGSNVVLASRNRTALNQLAKEVKGLPGRALVVLTDVTDREAVNKMAWRAVDEFGSIEVLVNNAGVGLRATIAEGSVENIRHVFEVNLFGAIHCLQAVAPHMKERGRGAIINVSSVVGRLATPYSGAYAATKGALNALTDSIRLELAPHGIRVTAVYPGYTITGFQQNVLSEIEVPEPSRLVRGVKPDAVAKTILRVIRDESRESYVTLSDAMAVMLKGVSPRLIDWGMRRMWLSGRRPKGAG